MNFATQVVSVPAWWLLLAALSTIGFCAAAGYALLGRRGVPDRNNGGRFFGGMFGMLFLATLAGFARSFSWGLVGALVCCIWFCFATAIHGPRGN